MIIDNTKDCVHPIVGHDKVDWGGNGIVIGNLFITAGHIALMYGYSFPVLKYQGKQFKCHGPLLVSTYSDDKENVDGEDPEFYSHYVDIAVYRIDGLQSTLHLSEDRPNVGEKLESFRYSFPVDPIAITENNITPVSGVAIVGDELEPNTNFIYCNLDKDITSGACGSPIFKGNVIFGILSIGSRADNHSSFGIYVSSTAIIKFLRDNGIELNDSSFARNL